MGFRLCLIFLKQKIHPVAVVRIPDFRYGSLVILWSMTMPNINLPEVLEQLEKILKDKPNFNKLLGGSGYRNGYEDGYKHAVKRFKAFRDDVLKKDADKKDADKTK